MKLKIVFEMKFRNKKKKVDEVEKQKEEPREHQKNGDVFSSAERSYAEPDNELHYSGNDDIFKSIRGVRMRNRVGF